MSTVITAFEPLTVAAPVIERPSGNGWRVVGVGEHHEIVEFDWEVKPGMPERAVLECRISDADEYETAGVDDQRADGMDYCRTNGWGVAAIIVENDTSAWKRKKFKLPNGRYELRTDRPKFRWMINQLWDRRFDGLLAIDLDRAVRDPKDYGDLVDAVELTDPRLRVRSLTGNLRMDTPEDIAMGWFGVTFANKASGDTSRRVKRARLRQAREGRFGGGVRRFGFGVPMVDDLGRPVLDDKGRQRIDMNQVRPEEAAEIVKAATDLLAGISMRSIMRSMDERGITPVNGGKWQSKSLRQILLRPGIAGLAVNQGEILEGQPAPWEPIISRETWEAVKAVLNDPERRKNKGGNTPKWLLSGLAICGHPKCAGKNHDMRVSGTRKNGPPSYRCRVEGHNWLTAPGLEDYIVDKVVRRLSRPDVADLVKPVDTIDIAALAELANGYRAKINEAMELWKADLLPVAQYRTLVEEKKADIARLEAEIADAQHHDPLSFVIGKGDVREVWEAQDLGRQRAIIERLMTITVLPSKSRGGRQPGGKYFDESRVVITPKAE